MIESRKIDPQAIEDHDKSRKIDPQSRKNVIFCITDHTFFDLNYIFFFTE